MSCVKSWTERRTILDSMLCGERVQGHDMSVVCFSPVCMLKEVILGGSTCFVSVCVQRQDT